MDHELLAQLNTKNAKKQIQDRYHPSPLSFKNKEPSNDMKENLKPANRPSNPPSGPPNGPPSGPSSGPPSGPPTGPSSSSMFDFSKPTFSESYDYKPPDYLSSKPISKPPDYLGDKPISKPMSMDDYGDSEISDKVHSSNIKILYFAFEI